MKENDYQINRKVFLKISSLAGASLLVPKSVIDYHPQPTEPKIKENREEEPQEYPRVIDNFGIEKDGKIVDVFVNKDLVKKNILTRANKILSPDYFEKVEPLIDSLTLSFGERDIDDVITTETFRDGSKKKTIDEEISSVVTSKMSRLLRYDEPLGITMMYSGDPLIYFDTAKIPDWFFKSCWDHETSHFINYFDPKLDKDNSGFLKLLGTSLGIDLGISTGTVLTATNIYSKFKNEDIYKTIKNNKENIEKAFIGLVYATLIPSTKYASEIQYYNFSKSEENANKEAAEFPTPDEEFAEMIQVVPRS